MRTNIEIDDALMATAMRVFGARTKREAVEHALRTAIGIRQQAAIRDLRGIGWYGDEDEVRRNRWRQDPE